MRFVSTVVVLLLVACVAGCEERATQASVTATPASHVQKRAIWNTDPNAAVGIATRLLREHGFAQDDYQMAGASFDAEAGEWRIAFPHSEMRNEFDQMVVVVNDDDGSAQIVTD